MAYSLTKGQKNLIDSILALTGVGLGFIVQNANLFPGLPPGVIPLVGAIGFYAISDVTTYVDTESPPAVATIESQALDALQKARDIQGLTDTEKAVIATAIMVLQSKQATAKAS